MHKLFIIVGECLSDPHIVQESYDVFLARDFDNCFYKHFRCRFHTVSGRAFSITPIGHEVTKATPISSDVAEYCDGEMTVINIDSAIEPDIRKLCS